MEEVELSESRNTFIFKWWFQYPGGSCDQVFIVVENRNSNNLYFLHSFPDNPDMANPMVILWSSVFLVENTKIFQYSKALILRHKRSYSSATSNTGPLEKNCMCVCHPSQIYEINPKLANMQNSSYAHELNACGLTIWMKHLSICIFIALPVSLMVEIIKFVYCIKYKMKREQLIMSFLKWSQKISD